MSETTFEYAVCSPGNWDGEALGEAVMRVDAAADVVLFSFLPPAPESEAPPAGEQVLDLEQEMGNALGESRVIVAMKKATAETENASKYDQIIGFTIWIDLAPVEASSPKLPYLTCLAVDPAYGRKGVGKTLLDMAVKSVSNQGGDCVWLSTFADVPFNAPWYSRVGWSVVPDNEVPQILKDRKEAEKVTFQLEGRGRRVIMKLPCRA